MVSRRSVRPEVFSQEDIDLIEMKILVVVRSKQSENLCHRKGKGSLTMSISQGSVSPNFVSNVYKGKGKGLIFPYCSSMRGNTSLISDALE